MSSSCPESKLEAIHKKRNHLGILLAFLAVAMMAFSFACVPLYRMFCQVTGFGGTTQKVVVPSTKVTNRIITVRFNADVYKNLPWRFEPKQVQMKVRVGENAMAYYESENFASEPIVGMATYNVTPDKAGKYFSKIDCFCFEEQTLQPKQKVDMPVLFYVDSQFADDPDMDDVSAITLSYTFFKYKK